MSIVGEIRAFAFGSSGPAFRQALEAGWLPCDGAKLSIADHQVLYDAIEDGWGASDGVTFRLPNLWQSADFVMYLVYAGPDVPPETVRAFTQEHAPEQDS